MNNHPFHIVDKRPWPIITSFCIMSLTLGIILMFHRTEFWLFYYSFFTLIISVFQWWRDIIRESTFQGLHTIKVSYRLKLGIILFILSEVLFFLSFFWAFFHIRLSPSIDIGINWPPLGIEVFNPMGIPMLNTIILLTSGVSLTWAHRSIINNNFSQCLSSILITIFLGLYFSSLQLIEYYESSFSICDSVYGSIFFIGTGFHGFHVLIGTIFIIVSAFRLWKIHYSRSHHVGFECCAWYWHFVDVVWLFLYISIYWWGS